MTNAAGATRGALLPVCESCEAVVWSEPLLRFDVVTGQVVDDGSDADG